MTRLVEHVLPGGTAVWAEVAPDRCSSGHELAGNMTVGWWPCSCSEGNVARGHRTWTCGTCQEQLLDSKHTETVGGGAYGPSHG